MIETIARDEDALFAALDVASGFVIGKCYKRHRATEFLDFLKQIDSSVPGDLDVHIIMDNYATHKTPRIRAWLARRPRYHVHFTPTSASWINQVERWFAELTRKKIQRGVHTSVRQLEADIKAFIDAHNEDPKTYRWVKSADEILAAVKRFCQKADATLCGELQIQVTSRVVTNVDPTAHAEMEALRDAAAHLGSRDLSGCVLYSSSPPCPMCEAAAFWAHIEHLYFGDPIRDGGTPSLRHC